MSSIAYTLTSILTFCLYFWFSYTGDQHHQTITLIVTAWFAIMAELKEKK